MKGKQEYMVSGSWNVLGASEMLQCHGFHAQHDEAGFSRFEKLRVGRM